MEDKIKNFVRYAWFTTGYLLLVICWGAVVRLTGSGAGCGDHWPQCNGTIIPLAPSVETLIEFGHRLTSGLSILLVIGLVYAACRLFAPGSLVRKLAWSTFVFLIIEALLGAGLVIYHLVAEDSSVWRAVMSAVHLSNTFILVACSSLTAFFASFKKTPIFDRRLKFPERKQFSFIVFLLICVGMTGAIVALGDTLFPSQNLIEGIAKDFSPQSHFLLRLRILHPIVAVATALFLLFFSRARRTVRYYYGNKESWHQLDLLVYGQLAVGILNFLLMAPAWLQILHLLLADLIWIRFITAGASLFLVPEQLANKVSEPKVSMQTASPQKLL